MQLLVASGENRLFFSAGRRLSEVLFGAYNAIYQTHRPVVSLDPGVTPFGP